MKAYIFGEGLFVTIKGYFVLIDLPNSSSIENLGGIIMRNQQVCNLIGNNGIPICDEITLAKQCGS